MNSGPLKEFLNWSRKGEEGRLLQFNAIRARHGAQGNLSGPAPVDAAACTPVLLSDALREPTDPTEWLIENFLAKGGLAMLSAEPYVGKSAIAGWLTLQISAGRDVLGTRTNGRIPVMFWQGEGSRTLFCQRLEGAATKLGLNVATLPFYLQSPGFLADFSAPEFDVAVAAASERGIRLIIADTLGYFFSGDENSAKDFKNLVVRPLKDAARKYGVAFLIVHHFGKPSELKSAQHKTRGTSAMFGDFDLFLRLERDREDPAMRVLFFDKIKDAPERQPLLLRFDKESGVFSEQSATDVASRRVDEKVSQERAKEAECMKRILALIPIHPGLTKTEIATEMGGRKETVLKALDRLLDEGRVVRSKDPDNPRAKLGWYPSTTPAQRARQEELAKEAVAVPVPGGSR